MKRNAPAQAHGADSTGRAYGARTHSGSSSTVTCAGRPLFSGSFGHRALERAHGNDQRSLASWREYVTGSLSSKSGHAGEAQLSEAAASSIISAKSKVSSAGGASISTGWL